MATTLESFDFTDGRGKHNWDLWLDGQIWRLTKGEDFDSKPSSLRASAAKQADNRNKDLRFNVDGDTVVLQAINRA